MSAIEDRIALNKELRKRGEPLLPVENEPEFQRFCPVRSVAARQVKMPYGPMGIGESDRFQSWELASTRDCFTEMTDDIPGYTRGEMEGVRILQTVDQLLAADLREAATFGF